jgi:probable rRNA maturation factor
MLEALDMPRAELSLMLCDDPTIHVLNRQHRRKNKPTDVLAFALREGTALSGGDELLGDVVISLDTARRQAEERGHSLWAEVTMLLAHGLLHLLGYDHNTDAEERRMNARTDMLVSAAVERRGQSTRVAKAARSAKPAKKPRRAATPKRAAKPTRAPKAAREPGRAAKKPARKPARAAKPQR